MTTNNETEKQTTPTPTPTPLTDAQIEAIPNPKIKEILTLARRLKIEEAYANFNGSGGQGSVYGIDLEIEARIKDPNAQNYTLIPNPAWTEEHAKLAQLLDAEAEIKIGDTGYNYCDGEGGGGCIDFDLITGKANISLYQYKVIRCNEEEISFDLTEENPNSNSVDDN